MNFRLDGRGYGGHPGDTLERCTSDGLAADPGELSNLNAIGSLAEVGAATARPFEFAAPNDFKR